MKKTIRVVALFKARPEKINALKDFLNSFIPPTRKEKGCLKYELHQNTSDSTDFCFIEEWEDHQTLDTHLVSPHIKAALPRIGEFLMAAPDIRRYVEID